MALAPARFVTVVTGSSQGLGFHASASLAVVDPSTDIVFACRNVSAAKAAVAAVTKEHPKIEASRLVVIETPLRLDDLDSVRAYGE